MGKWILFSSVSPYISFISWYKICRKSLTASPGMGLLFAKITEYYKSSAFNPVLGRNSVTFTSTGMPCIEVFDK